MGLEQKLVNEALTLAQTCLDRRPRDVPVGCVVADAEGRVLAGAANERELRQDPLAHAELLAIARASRRTGARYLSETVLASTLEPCVMCCGAIAAARIPKVIFGAFNDQTGAAGSKLDLLRNRLLRVQTEVWAGVDSVACSKIIRDFFQQERLRRDSRAY